MTFERHVQIGNMNYIVEGTFDREWVDDSFDHAFGTERCGHYEVSDLIIDHVSTDETEIVPVKSLEDALKEILAEVLV